MLSISHSCRSSFGKSSFLFSSLKEQRTYLSATAVSSPYFWQSKNRLNSIGFKSLSTSVSRVWTSLEPDSNSTQSGRMCWTRSLIFSSVCPLESHNSSCSFFILCASKLIWTPSYNAISTPSSSNFCFERSWAQSGSTLAIIIFTSYFWFHFTSRSFMLLRRESVYLKSDCNL